MTGDLKFIEKIYRGAGAPATGDQITSDTSQYPVGTHYTDETNGALYVRTGTGRVTGDWTQIGSSGGSSYLVLIAFITQTGTSAPSMTTFSGANTLGAGNWQRGSAGVYTCLTTTDFNASKIWINGLFSDSSGDLADFIPISNGGSAIAGSYAIYCSNVGGKIQINLFIQNDTGVGADISLVMASPRFNLPEIRVYP